MNKYRYIILILLVGICFVGLGIGTAIAQTYDATGTWDYVTSNNWVDPGTAGCDADDDEQGTVSVTQTGSNVTLVIKGLPFTGTVSGATYTFSGMYPEQGGMTSAVLTFTLTSDSAGTGTLTWSWTDGVDSCNGGCDISVSRAAQPTYDATGTWNYVTTNNWVNPGNAGCPADPNEQGTVTINQTGTNVTVIYKGDSYTGTVSGADYAGSVSYPEDGGITTVEITFTLTSSTAGSGTIVWSWTDGVESCNGGCDISFSKSGGGGGGGDTGGGGGGGCFISTLSR